MLFILSTLFGSRAQSAGYFYSALLTIFAIFFSQTNISMAGTDTADISTLPDIYVTASRTEKASIFVPNEVYKLFSHALIEERIVRTVPEAMEEVPGIMVQKTSQGQGSPYIRGFTGYRTLFLIDGIRLNNSTFREGPNQYWNTVDVYSIDKMEIIKGPGSVLYGSDAVGGTVNAMTIVPSFEGNNGYNTQGRLYGRYSSGEQSWTGRGEIGGNYDKLAGWIAGYTYKDFGNVIGGHQVGEQQKTGYNEWDGDIKLEYKPVAGRKFIIAHQRVDIDDAWRTHKTIYGINWKSTTHGNEKKRILDQDRNLTYLQYHQDNIGSVFNNLILSISFQKQKEQRHRVKKDSQSEKQGVDVGTTGFWGQLSSDTPIGTITYGVDYYHDSVNSWKRKYNSDGSLKKKEIQGPVADDASYDLLGAFIQDDFFLGERFELIAGGRFTYAHAGSDKVRNPITGGRMSLHNHWTAFTGSLRGVYFIDENGHYSVFGGISQAFRAPNLSDLTRFDTARTDEFEVAAPDLDPEKFVSFEIGFKTSFNNFSSQAAYFYTDINDMIIRTPTGRVIDGNYEVTKKNAGNGYVNGVELSASWKFYPDFQANASFSWMYGEVDTYPTSLPKREREPLDRLMPLTVQGSIKWQPHWRYWIEGVAIHAEKQDQLSTRDKNDTDRIPPGGTPSYTVLTLRGGWKLNEKTTLSAALENIADVDYRIHGSGVNEPGRNLIISMDIKF